VRGKRRGFSPGADAHHRGRTAAPKDCELFFPSFLGSFFEIGHVLVSMNFHSLSDLKSDVFL